MIKFPHCILLFLILTGLATSAEKPKTFKKINIPITPDIADKLKTLEAQEIDVVWFLKHYGVAFDEGTTAVLVERPTGEFYISSTNDDANNGIVKNICVWLSEHSPWFTAEMLITGDESVREARDRAIHFGAHAESLKKSN